MNPLFYPENCENRDPFIRLTRQLLYQLSYASEFRY